MILYANTLALMLFEHSPERLNDYELVVAIDMPAAGYHSVAHARYVARVAAQLTYESGFSVTDVRCATLAGYFHDAAHSRNADVPDYVNLARAIDRWTQYAHDVGFSFTDAQMRVTELILATNSAVTNTDSYDELARIMYDADTLAGYEIIADGLMTRQAYEASLHDEGYYTASSPEAFIAMRGLRSAAARKRYAHLIES